MKKFQFTLQSLLNVKISLEKQQKAELARVEGQLKAARDELDLILLRVDTARAEYERKLRAGMRPLTMTTYAVGFRALSEKIHAQEHKIEVIEQEKVRVQKRLVELMAERKTLEKLKERQFEEYREESRREEAKVIDDFMSHKAKSSADRRGE